MKRNYWIIGGVLLVGLALVLLIVFLLPTDENNVEENCESCPLATQISGTNAVIIGNVYASATADSIQATAQEGTRIAVVSTETSWFDLEQLTATYDYINTLVAATASAQAGFPVVTHSPTELVPTREGIITPTAEQSATPSFTEEATEEPIPLDGTPEATESTDLDGTPEETEVGIGDDPTPLPTLIAAAPVSVIDNLSGQRVGTGMLRIYAPEKVTRGESFLVELEISLNSVFITPIPGESADTPPTSENTATPPPTEQPPIITQPDVLFYERMVASLSCSAESFSGCDPVPNLDRNLRRVTVNGIEGGTSWSWSLIPVDAAQGWQDLRLELLKVELRTSATSETPIFELIDGQSFRIEIASTVAAKENGNSLAIPIFIGLIVIFGSAGAWVFSQRRKKPLHSKAPIIFLSYQRKTGWATARSIHDRLRQLGGDVFIDVEDINEGRFAQIIEQAIQQCDYFVPILAPGTLDSIWVRREIETALQHGKQIIPVLISGFVLDETLPDDIKDLSNHNAVAIVPEYFEAAIEKLARFVGLGN